MLFRSVSIHPRRGYVCSGCSPEWVDAYYQAAIDALKPSRFYGLQYAYFRVLGNYQRLPPLVHGDMERFGITYYVGSEYVTGLYANTDRAIKEGLRLITAPQHELRRGHRITPETFAAFKYSTDRYRQALARKDS